MYLYKALWNSYNLSIKANQPINLKIKRTIKSDEHLAMRVKQIRRCNKWSRLKAADCSIKDVTCSACTLKRGVLNHEVAIADQNIVWQIQLQFCSESGVDAIEGGPRRPQSPTAPSRFRIASRFRITWIFHAPSKVVHVAHSRPPQRVLS
jgi:hypothetical protein